MMTNLQPRHKKALIDAYQEASRSDDHLRARYLREVLKLLDISKPEPPKATSVATKVEVYKPEQYKLSIALSNLVGFKVGPRTEVVQSIWNYIKRKRLQDPFNKRMINCDEKLRPVFGCNRISMFEMAGKLSSHLTRIN